jgi:hypothetical protein
MASKKKLKKKSPKSKRAVNKKATPAKKQARKKSAAKTVTRAKTATKKRLKKSPGRKTVRTVSTQPPKTNWKRGSGSPAFVRESSRSRFGEQSGDLQGLSNVESADSESVDELLEEGNAFEAGVVSGVEDSGKREGKEVRTREVPEDDVPEEYLDPD